MTRIATLSVCLGLISTASVAQTVRIDPVPTWQNAKPIRCNAIDLMALDPRICDARAVAAARREVGELLAKGDCEAALKGALTTGDLTFAREVRDYCSPPAAQDETEMKPR